MGSGLGFKRIALLFAVAAALLIAPALSGKARAQGYLSDEERAFLDSHGRIRLIYDWKYPPFEFVEDDGSFAGLASDLVKELERELGVTITAEAEQDWPTLLDKLKSRRADMAPAMAYTAERARYLLFTDPYAHLPTVIFTQKDFREISGLADLRGLRVGVVNGYVSHIFLQNNYQDYFRIVPMNNIQEGLRAVAFGEVDAFVENVGVASYYIEQEGLRNLRVAAETEHQTALCMAVRSDMPLLHSAIQKALQHLPPDRKQALVENWVHVQTKQVRTLRWSLNAAVALLSLMVLLLAFLLSRARRARADSQARSKALAAELERSTTLQAALRNSEVYLRSILDNSEAVIVKLDPQGTLLFAGGKDLARAGLAEAATPGASAFGLFAENSPISRALRTALAGEREKFTSRIGEEYYQGACTPVLDDDATLESVVLVATNVTELESMRRSLHMSEEHLKRQNAALLALVSSGALFQGDLARAVADITEACSALIGTERVSVWLYGEDYSEIRCIDLYRRSSGQHHSGETLRCDTFPAYAASHMKGEIVSAADVRTDPRTRDIPSAYYEKHGISSLMDVSVWLHDRLGGLLSLEHVGEPRMWTPEEENVGTNMATLLSLCFEINERKLAEEALRVSENRFKALFTQSPISVLIHDKDSGEIIDANHAAIASYGCLTLEELKASDFWLDSPYSFDDAVNRVRKAAVEGPQKFEWLSRRMTGELFWEHIHLSPVIINGVERVMASTIDITERKRLELRLADQLAFQQALLDTIPYAVFYKNTEARFMGCNSAYETTFGVQREDFIGKRVLDLEYLPEQDRLNYQAEDEATIASVGRVRKEMAIPFADGQIHQTLYSVNGFRQADGSPGGLIGVIVDISDLKRAEMALRESEARYRSVIENIQDMYYRTDNEGRLVLLSPSTPMQLGYESQAEMLGRPATDFYLDPSDRQELLRRIREEGAVKDYEILLKTRDGHPLLVSTTSVFYHDGEGAVLGVEGIFRDITERKRMERALRASEEKYRSIFDNAPIGIFRTTFAGRFLEANTTLARMVGYDSSAELIRHVEDVGTDLYYEPRFKSMLREALLDTPSRASMEVEFKRRDGSRFYAFINASLQFDRHGQPAFIDGTIEDINERKRSEEKYRVIFQDSNDAIFLIKDNRIVDCNPRTLAIFNCPLERMLGHSPGEFSPPAQPDGRASSVLAAEMIERARQGLPHTFEWQHQGCDGRIFATEVTLSVMDMFSEEYVVGFLRDISDRKAMQELMVQTEKMMSVGGLAAGMAHELNNPLGVILQSVQNMERRLSTSLPKNNSVARELGLNLETLDEYMRARGIDGYIEGIREAGDRAAKIIRTMLDFSRRSQSARATCQVHEMLDTALGLAANDYDLKRKYDFKSIIIERDYALSNDSVECTETEIVQVFLNIIKNAAQAMSLRGDRTEPPALRLRTRPLPNAVRIEITDNGPGMDDELRRRVFEPFITTKPPGEGTGLGLSVAYFIITQKHRGLISAERAPGGGTTFIIELPLCSDGNHAPR